MTKTDLVEVIYHRHGGISRRESQEIVDQLLARIKRELRRARRVQISGFGSFEVVRRESRKGRNPKTGETIQIGPKQSLIFRPSRSLVTRIQ
jgi:nucleoid DNA-binding protein